MLLDNLYKLFSFIVGVSATSTTYDVHCQKRNALACEVNLKNRIDGPYSLHFVDADQWNETKTFVVNSRSVATHIPDGILQRFPAVTELRINTRLTSISADDFQAAKALTELNLQFNSIHHLSGNIFIKLERLEQLHLSSNHLRTIEDNAFNGLSKLRYLALDTNDLTEIKRNTFAGASSLESLDLEFNKITTIENDALNLPSLQYLSLSRNPIGQLPDGFFNGIPNLIGLSMGSDKLTTIDRSLYDMRKLRALKMGYNLEVVLDFEALLRMPALERLDLEGMRFVVPAKVSTATTVSSLTDLRLSGNNISTSDIIDRLKTFNLRNLEKLDLIFNNLCSVSGLDDLHAHFPQLKRLELGSNPMSCSTFDAIADTLNKQSIEMKKYNGACWSGASLFC